MNKGYIHLYTGNGKGKTTAALGLILRAVGAGFRVWVGQFAKGSKQSEHKALEQFNDYVTIELFGRPGFITGDPGPEDITLAQSGLMRAKEILQAGKYQIVVLDEALIGIHFKLFSVEKLLDIVKIKPDHVELIITGRNAPQQLIDVADLVTEMKEIKHYYTTGVQARKGIEM